jgi:hypothetical protein
MSSFSIGVARLLLCASVFAFSFQINGSSAFTITGGTLRMPLKTDHSVFLSSFKSGLRMSDSKDSSGDDDDDELKTSVVAEAKPVERFNYFKGSDIMSDSTRVDAALGLGRGSVLLTVVLLINIWFFSIPPEFRRTRLCDDMDAAAYPDRCMTSTQFVEGIKDYYSNGKGEWL